LEIGYYEVGRGGSAFELIQKRYGIDKVLVKAQLFRVQTEGQTHQLGEVDDGKVKSLLKLLFGLLLAGIQVDMA
jgi:hypothetical protein